MALSHRTIGILGALLISAGFIALGYYLSSPLSPRFADASSTEELLKAYAEKDTDADGLPDWKESLYRTDPENAHSVSASMTDAEAVASGKVDLKFSSSEEGIASPPSPESDEDYTVPAPAEGSLTEEFSRVFLSMYAEQGTADGAQNEKLVAALTSELSARIKERTAPTYQPSMVVVSDTATAESYAAGIERALIAHSAEDEARDPFALIEQYIIENDASAKPNLLILATSYTRIGNDLRSIPVPARYKNSHLTLVRSFELLGSATEMVAGYDEDPLATLGALSLYIPTFTAIGNSLEGLVGELTADGGPAAGEPGALLVETVGTPTP